MAPPDGWTDDMNIQLGPDRTLDELVDFVFLALARQHESAAITAKLVEHFGLSEQDAALALDRTCGGVARAATGNRKNRPVQQKDPIAWLSYRRCLQTPSLIAAVYPEYAHPSRAKKNRRSGGALLLLGIFVILVLAIWIVLALRH